MNRDQHFSCGLFQINWLHYMNNITGPSGYSVSNDESIVVLSPEYLSAVSDLVMETKATEEGKM